MLHAQEPVRKRRYAAATTVTSSVVGAGDRREHYLYIGL